MKTILSGILTIPIYLLLGWATRNYFAWHSEAFSILGPLFHASERLGLSLNHAAIIVGVMLLISLLLAIAVVQLVALIPTFRFGARKRLR